MNKIIFENLPSTNTPINANNLNQMQDNIEQTLYIGNFTADQEIEGQNVELTYSSLYDDLNIQASNKTIIIPKTGLYKLSSSIRFADNNNEQKDVGINFNANGTAIEGSQSWIGLVNRNRLITEWYAELNQGDEIKVIGNCIGVLNTTSIRYGQWSLKFLE